ncbi:hypothetical protein [Sphingosinicella terrae]|uniref:hypothetical protein n=1 Tax=Sphingosinicella terrae TaxID=2172047 RepID=UPI000E0D7512|nr:hypothetical protein [Sphingosinicella terrae]
MIQLGRTILLWLARHALALILILIILIAGRYAWEPVRNWVRAQSTAAQSLPAARAAHADARDRFETYAAARAQEIELETARLAEAPAAALRARRSAIDPALAEVRKERLGGGALALAATQGDSDALFAHARAGAEIALLERERNYIDSLLAARASDSRRSSLAAQRQDAARRVAASHRQWLAARDRAAALNRRPLAGPRNFVCRNARPGIGCDHYQALREARADMASALAANRRAHAEIRAIDRSLGAMTAARAAAADAAALFEAERAATAARLQQAERALRANWLIWIRRPIVEMLPTALAILAAAMLAPPLVKAFLYFVIAPLAARRRPIRLLPGDRGEIAAASAAPAVSQPVPVTPADELLVVPEAVQSTPHDAAKATQWLLRTSMPLTSLAAGMAGLIRIRSRRPETVLVSATADPLAEIALVEMAAGSALVLRPRALRGLLQPIGRPVRITRHWRLAHLSAWLTLQFRYIVFHGPCTLIVQGRRGVRLERAARGRGINQAATIGFSAGLAYSVRRSEAFGAYLLGRQDLFNDSFEDGDGFCLYEEMPREGARAGLWGRGLEGLGDAALKVFGI